MKILYASCICSEDKYKELFGTIANKPGQQVQKYNRLMAEGLAQIVDVDVYTATIFPITADNCRRKFVKEGSEISNGVKYKYLCLINLPLIKRVMSFLFCFIYCLYFFIKNEDSYLISDCLNQSAALGSVLACKLAGKKALGIVTDLPDMLPYYNKVLRKVNNFIINRFDSYVFLTEEMSNYINKSDKPYVVIEGHVDINMKQKDISSIKKYDDYVCMYTGSLDKQNGINYLAEAFTYPNLKHVKLHIYGDGNYRDELVEICKKNDNILYYGTVLNDYIVNEQQKALLLINPRPTNNEFTKYSFPSKNMEYMVSGTPLLTTDLPGMPRDYREYVFIIKEEVAEKLSLLIQDIMELPQNELNKKGQLARSFVLEKKNNVIQAQRIIKLLKILN